MVTGPCTVCGEIAELRDPYKGTDGTVRGTCAKCYSQTFSGLKKPPAVRGRKLGTHQKRRKRT